MLEENSMATKNVLSKSRTSGTKVSPRARTGGTRHASASSDRQGAEKPRRSRSSATLKARGEGRLAAARRVRARRPHPNAEGRASGGRKQAARKAVHTKTQRANRKPARQTATRRRAMTAA
jgi:hypothetical protein